MKLECKNIHNKHVELDIPSVVTISDLTGYSALTDLVIDTDYENTNIYSPIICRNATATVLTDDIGWYNLLIDTTYSCDIKETREVNGVDVEYTIWSGYLSSISESNAFANGKEPITLYMIDELSKLKNIIIRKDSDGVIRRSDTETGFPNEFTIIEFKNMFMNSLSLVSEIGDTNFYDIKFPISAYINAIGDEVNAFDILKQMAIFLSIQVSIGQNNVLYFKKNILIQSETNTKAINFSGNDKNIINTDNLAVGLNPAINKVSVTSSIQEKEENDEEEEDVFNDLKPYRVINLYKNDKDLEDLDDIVVNNDTEEIYRYRAYQCKKNNTYDNVDTWWARPCRMYQYTGMRDQHHDPNMNKVDILTVGNNRFYMKPNTTYYGYDCNVSTMPSYAAWLYNNNGVVPLNAKYSAGTRDMFTLRSTSIENPVSSYWSPAAMNQIADDYLPTMSPYKSRAVEVETKLNNGDTKHSTMIINAGNRFYYNRGNYPAMTEAHFEEGTTDGNIVSHFDPVIRIHKDINNFAEYSENKSRLFEIRCSPSVIFKEKFGDYYPDKDSYEDIEETMSIDTEVTEMKYEDQFTTGGYDYKTMWRRGGLDAKWYGGSVITKGNMWPAIGIQQLIYVHFDKQEIEMSPTTQGGEPRTISLDIQKLEIPIINAFVCDCPKEGKHQDFFNVEYKPDMKHYEKTVGSDHFRKYGSLVYHWETVFGDIKPASNYIITDQNIIYINNKLATVSQMYVKWIYVSEKMRLDLEMSIPGDTEGSAEYFSISLWLNEISSNILMRSNPPIYERTKKPEDGEMVTTFGSDIIDCYISSDYHINDSVSFDKIYIDSVDITYYLRNEMWLAGTTDNRTKIQIPNIVFNHEEEYEIYDYINGTIVDNDNNNAEVEYTWINDKALTTNEVTQDMKFSSLTGNIINGANIPSINGTPVTTLTYGWNKNYTPEQNYFGLLYSQYYNNPFTVNLDVKGYFEPYAVFNINSTTINQIKANSTKYKPLQMSYNVIDSITSVNMESIEPIDESLDINIIDQ